MAGVDSETVTEPGVSPSQSVDRTPSRRVSVSATSDLSSGEATYSADALNRASSLDHSPSTSGQLDSQNQLSLRSEEYRQLFHLTLDEVLIQDFNCALQENFLLQGHMYLFSHYICFYSNLFGFETKKIIPFHEVTSVRRAKAAAIFPTAIEILAGGKKFFFTSFLSRDEAFKLINDGWVQRSNGIKLITNQQESKPDLNSRENRSVTVENEESPSELVDELDLIERYTMSSTVVSIFGFGSLLVVHECDNRDKDCSTPEDLTLPVDEEPESLSTSAALQDAGEADVEIVQSTDYSTSRTYSIRDQEDSGAPGVPECFVMVAESKFPVKVEDFFVFFFSDDAVGFQDSFHKKCGDKDFRCTKWSPDEKFGHTRDVSFQHPIKLYLGAKFGSCREIQKYQVYKNSHLVVETSQQIADVPYGDYFCVEGLWHVERDGDETKTGCILRVYINVNFSKNTMFKGKIAQSTVEECRDACAIWMELAHEFLKQKKLEVEESGVHASSLIPDNELCLGKEERGVDHLENSNEATGLRNLEDVNREVVDSLQGSYKGTSSLASSFTDFVLKLCSSLKRQSHISLLLLVSIAVILLLMQISILVLLSRPQQIHVVPQADWIYNLNKPPSDGGSEVPLIDKQINNLKEEVRMVETMLDKMHYDLALLKLKLKDMELLRKQPR